MTEQLKKIYNDAIKERDEILASIEPLRAEEEEALKVVNAARAKLLEIRDRIVALEEPRLAEVCKTISILAPNNRKLSNTEQ